MYNSTKTAPPIGGAGQYLQTLLHNEVVRGPDLFMGEEDADEAYKEIQSTPLFVRLGMRHSPTDHQLIVASACSDITPF
eukprot:1540427-Prymnesium_polylepis.1